MEFKVSAIAALLGGTVEGDGEGVVSTAAKIQEAMPGAICFFANPKYEPYVYETVATAIIVNNDFQPKQPVKATLIRVENAQLAFTALLEQYQAAMASMKLGVEEPAFLGEGAVVGEGCYRGFGSYIGAGAKIGNNVKIYPQVYLGDGVVVGDGTTIYSGVKVYRDCVIGKNCIIHSNAVIGADGFGYVMTPEGRYKNVPQLGNVVLGDFVDVGANATIDRATMGSTVIGAGVKIDNLVQIAHNVTIGDHTAVAAQAGISGSVKLGRYNVVGGQVGFAGHIETADKVMFGAQAGVGKNIKKVGSVWQGTPIQELKDFQRSTVVFRRLPELQKRVEWLEEQLTQSKG